MLNDTYMFQMIQKSSIWQVLAQFLEKPDKKHHIRAISRTINLATTSVKKNIDALISEGLVTEKKEIFKYYVAKRDQAMFKFYQKIHFMNVLEQSGVLDYLEDTTGCEAIILFGSASKGEAISTSDIDLYIQAPEQNVDMNMYEEKISRKIQLFFAEDVPDELKNNISNGLKLRGYMYGLT